MTKFTLENVVCEHKAEFAVSYTDNLIYEFIFAEL